MENRALGNTGIAVSVLAQGTWELGGLWWGPVDANDGVALCCAVLWNSVLRHSTLQTSTGTAGRK